MGCKEGDNEVEGGEEMIDNLECNKEASMYFTATYAKQMKGAFTVLQPIAGKVSQFKTVELPGWPTFAPGGSASRPVSIVVFLK